MAKKKLFIEDLEKRRSTSPLFVTTLAAGEQGTAGKSQDTAKKQSGQWKPAAAVKVTLPKPAVKIAPVRKVVPKITLPVAKKPTTGPARPIGIIAQEPPVSKKPIEDPGRPIGIIAQETTLAVGEEGGTPIELKPVELKPGVTPDRPIVIASPPPPDRPIGIVAPMTTLAVGEEGGTPIELKPVELKPGVTPDRPIVIASPPPPDRPIGIVAPMTTMAIGEEGGTPAPDQPKKEQ